jgi:hypothetical protein
MMMRTLLLTSVLAVTACGGYDNRLEGSISASFSLDFDSVLIRKQGNDLIVEYHRIDGATDTKVAKIVLDTENLNNLGDDSRITGDLFRERVVVQREAATGGDFPAVQEGELALGDFEFEDGGKISGSVNVGFTTGRTLYGEFNGNAEDVPLD